MNEKLPRCLLVDDYHVGELHRPTRRLNQPRKHPSNPVLRPECPWEKDRIWSKNATIWDDEEKAFRMWYAVPGDRGHQTCVASSSDGVVWERPDLGRQDFDGSKKNNLIGGEVFQIVHGADEWGEPAAAQRYRCVSWSHEQGQYLQTSPDGLRWPQGPSLEIFGAGDTFILRKRRNL